MLKASKRELFGAGSLASNDASLSRWDHLDRNPIVCVPSGVVEFDPHIRKISLERASYPPEILFLALTQFRRGVQVKGHRLVPCAVLMLN
jgi:hypothetical protein